MVIIFVLMLVGMVYGMNFDVMFELYWVFGYLMVIGVMFVFVIGLFGVFKYKRWF